MNVKLSLRAILIATFVAIVHSFAYSQVDKIVTFGTSNETFPKISSKFFVLNGNSPLNVLSSELTLQNSFGETDFEFLSGNIDVETSAQDFVFCVSLSGSMQSKLPLIRDSWEHYLTLLELSGSQSAVIGYSESLLLLSDFSDEKTKLRSVLNELPFSNSEDIANLILKSDSHPLLGKLLENRDRKSSVILVIDEFYDELPNFELDELITGNVSYYTIVLNGFASDNYKKLCQMTNGTYFENISDATQLQSAITAIYLHAAGFEPNEILFYDKSCSKVSSVLLSHSGINSEINYLTQNQNKARFEFSKGTSINFGIVKSPQIRRDSLFLTAKNADLKVFNIEIDLPFRIINKPVTPFVLSKDSTLKIEIEYVPTDTAYKYGQVRIQSDLCNETILHLAGGSVFSPNFVETLKILQPNGGETLFAGGYYDIKWRGILPIDEVTIDHSFDNGNFWNTIGIGDQMNFRWNPVTNRISNLNKIRLRHTSKEGSTKKIVSLNGLNNRVVSLKWNNHATQLFTAGQDGFIRIWDPVQADPLRTIASGLFKIIDMDLSYDDQYLAHISSDDSLIHIINLDDNLTTTTFSYNNELISKLDWHPTEHQLLAATESGKIILIDAISQSFIKVYTPDNSRANDAKWSPKGDLIVAGYSSGNIAICYLADDSVAVLKNSDARVNSVSINASGMTISVASDLETITIWNLTTQSIVLNMQNHSKNVKITSWDPKLKFVATTSLDSTISLWEPSTGTVKHRFSYHNNVVSAFEWSNDGKKIASGTIEGEVLIWSPDDLPFENQFTQIDISDNTFSIIMPNIETSELDFGNLYYKDRVDSSFVKNIVFNNVLINRNFQTIRIDSISVKYNTNPVDAFKATYRFINYFPIELAKDENLELIAQLKTTYKNIKRKSDTLLYYTNAGIFKSIIRYGIGKQILLNISDNIDFGKVPLGDSAALAVRIRNLSNEFDYTINSIADFIPETNDFDFSELIGTKILKNNSKDINLKFLPKETGKTSKLLVCEVIENNELLENLTYDIELYGEGIAPKIAFSGFMDKIEVLCDDSIGRKEMFIYNIGNHELQIRNITIEDNPNNKFQLDLSATNFLVPAGDSTSFIITYESLDIGFDQALIVVETNITKEWKTIHKKNILAKRELSEFEFSQNKLRFLVDDINSSQTRTFQIRNTGTIPIFWSLPESSDLFVVENIFPMNTLPDDSSEVTVKFLGSQSLGYFDSKFDFRDTCHNIQSLIVDAYVGPNSAKIKIPEFLNLPDLICEKQSPEYTIEITNTGATPLFIDNIYFTNGDFVDFEIVNFPASDRIDAGKTGIVKFVFAPQTPGIKKSYLAIESNATNSIEGKNLIEINAFAGHIEIELTPSQIFFESLIQNKEYQETTIANNKSNIPIFWQYPIESTHFSIDSIIPKMTAPGESSVIFVTFKGGTTGNTYSEIFEFELPCDYELALELFADVQRLASTGIKAGFITAKPGDTVMLPLYLYSPSDVGLPQTLGYKTQLKFNSKIMYPLTENKGVLEGNYRILDIDLPANPIDGETAIEIPFLATLGDTIDTEIRIQNSIAISSEEITIEEVSGYFSLDSLCIEGGVRLIANTGRFNLLQNYPNPADETTTFKFSAIERGIHKLVIVDINGAHVATVFETELQAGTFEVNFSVSKFAIGNYIYRLIGPNLELNKKMTILR